jgi:hypothetical protein
MLDQRLSAPSLSRALLRVLVIVTAVAAGAWTLQRLSSLVLILVLSALFAYVIAPLADAHGVRVDGANNLHERTACGVPGRGASRRRSRQFPGARLAQEMSATATLPAAVTLSPADRQGTLRRPWLGRGRCGYGAPPARDRLQLAARFGETGGDNVRITVQ